MKNEHKEGPSASRRIFLVRAAAGTAAVAGALFLPSGIGRGQTTPAVVKARSLDLVDFNVGGISTIRQVPRYVDVEVRAGVGLVPGRQPGELLGVRGLDLVVDPNTTALKNLQTFLVNTDRNPINLGLLQENALYKPSTTHGSGDVSFRRITWTQEANRTGFESRAPRGTSEHHALTYNLLQNPDITSVWSFNPRPGLGPDDDEIKKFTDTEFDPGRAIEVDRDDWRIGEYTLQKDGKIDLENMKWLAADAYRGGRKFVHWFWFRLGTGMYVYAVTDLRNLPHPGTKYENWSDNADLARRGFVRIEDTNYLPLLRALGRA